MFEAEIAGIWKALRANRPLIHCITNPIAINDCANVLLAAGARPIMAEHPDEVAEITVTAAALSVNLGNVTDARIKSMRIAGLAAKNAGKKVIIDVVGTACSSLRLEYAGEYIKTVKPDVIKGNISELMALAGLESSACGIDAGEKDLKMAAGQVKGWIEMLAKKFNAVVIATGEIDYISDGHETYAVLNGCEKMSWLTGTGCMLTVVIAAMLSGKEALMASLAAVSVFGLCGELADKGQGMGSYHAAFLDEVSMINREKIINSIRIERVY